MFYFDTQKMKSPKNDKFRKMKRRTNWKKSSSCRVRCPQGPFFCEKRHFPVKILLSPSKSYFPCQNLTFPVKIETFPNKIETFHSKKLFLTQTKFSFTFFFSKVYHSYSKTLYPLKNPQKYVVETLIFHKISFIKMLIFPLKNGLTSPNQIFHKEKPCFTSRPILDLIHPLLYNSFFHFFICYLSFRDQFSQLYFSITLFPLIFKKTFFWHLTVTSLFQFLTEIVAPLFFFKIKHQS